MDISDSTDTPTDGRPPIEAVAATAAEPEAEDDRASGSTAALPHTERQDVDEKQDVPDKHEQSNQEGADTVYAADASKKAKASSRSAIGDLQKPSIDDSAGFSGKLREHWWQLNRLKDPPPPPPDSLDDAKTLPLGKVNFLNELLYIWITPIIKLGKHRPLQVCISKVHLHALRDADG